MNRIEAVLERASEEEEEHLVIHVDGQPLDAMLSTPGEEDELEGLVPTLLGWLDDKREQALVWERILPENATRIRAPVLMCPEHRDLFCTTVIAEVRATAEQVEWRRIGIDDTPEEDLPELVGQDVYWLQDIGPFTFERSQYVRMMNAFRQGSIHGGTLH